MSLKETLTEDMKTAMKARDKDRLATIRLLLSNLKNIEINSRKDLTEADEIAFLASEAKKRRESIAAYEDADRDDLVQKEAAELSVIETYLPKQLSEDEVRGMVQEVVDEIGATSKKDFGRVMGTIMPKLKGKFPGKKVKPIVESVLTE